MNSIIEEFKNYKKSEIENLLYMRVDELIDYRDELLSDEHFRKYEEDYMLDGMKDSDDFGMMEVYPEPSFWYISILSKIECICHVISYKRSCIYKWFYSKRANKINEDVIIQRIKEKIKFNPYVSYEQLIQLDTSTSINSVLEYLIDTKQLGVVKLDKENKYGEHKWRWK